MSADRQRRTYEALDTAMTTTTPLGEELLTDAIDQIRTLYRTDPHADQLLGQWLSERVTS